MDKDNNLKKYSINGWDYHGHHSTSEFVATLEEAIKKWEIECIHSYGRCTLYECPNGFRNSCQTISEAGYIVIRDNNK